MITYGVKKVVASPLNANGTTHGYENGIYSDLKMTTTLLANADVDSGDTLRIAFVVDGVKTVGDFTATAQLTTPTLIVTALTGCIASAGLSTDLQAAQDGSVNRVYISKKAGGAVHKDFYIMPADVAASATDPTVLDLGYLLGMASAVCDTPQQVSFTPSVTSGQEVELRGGDDLVKKLTEPDKVTGMDMNFNDAIINGYMLKIMCGGWYTPSTTDFDLGDYIPYSGTISDTLDGSPRGFSMRIFISEFSLSGQSQFSSDRSGYVMFKFFYCQANLPQFTAQDRNFLVPQYTVKGKENTKELTVAGTTKIWQWVRGFTTV